MNDFEFVYSDCDAHASELAELYTYSEIEDWAANMHAYRHYAESKQVQIIILNTSFPLKGSALRARNTT